jgi:hypothetical protein
VLAAGYRLSGPALAVAAGGMRDAVEVRLQRR